MEAIDEKISICEIGGVAETIMVEADDQRVIALRQRAEWEEFMYRQPCKYVVDELTMETG